MITIDRQLKALANKRRLAIIKFLDKQTEASVGEIAENIRLSFKSTSRHLSILVAAEIIDKEQKSRNVFYYLTSPRSSLVKQILSLL